MGRDTPAPHELSEMESLHAQLERERAIATRLFGLANSCDDLHALLREATALLHEWSGCDAVGIRLREGDDFPYFETRGFPPEFVEAENSLCVPDLKGQVARDFQGNPILECMCGNILCGRFDPALPFFSPGGSFWTNGTTELLASTTEAQRQARTRNRCNGQGYESVALIPLRSEGATLGLLQLNDRQKGRFSARLILALEQFAAAIAGAVEHCLVSRQLTQTRAQLQEQNAELGESYRRLAGLLDAVDQSLLLMSRDGTIIECNQVFASRLGHTREELLGSDVYCHLPPDVARQRRQRVEEAADSRMVVGFVDEQWGRRLAHRIVPIMDEHGNVIQFAAQGTDITQQSQSHERLQRSNELLRAVKDVQALFISETDPKRVFQGLLKILVQFTQSEYGFLDEVLAREDGTTFKRNLAITDISWDDASRRLFDQLASAEYVFPNLDNLAGAPVTLGRVVISNNPACDRRSGGLPSGHPPLGCFLGIPLHSAGKMVGVAGVANRPGGYTEEVAEFIEPLAATCAGMIAALQTRRKAEEAEAKYRVVADNTYDWEFWVSPEGHFRYVSPSCQRITGYEPAEFMADPELFLRIVHPADREDVRRYMQSGSAGHRGLEFRIVRKDGTLRWIGLRCQPVCDAQGRPWGVRGSNRDITQRKQSERLLIIERDLAAALNGAHEMHDILRHSLSAALDATGFDCGGVYLPHGPSGELRLAHHAGLSTAFVEAAATFGPGSQQSLLVSRGEFVQFDGELLADPAFAHLWQEGLRSLVVVPVVHEGRVLACLNLASRNPVTLSAWRRNALEALALQMGTAIDRAAAEAALRRSQAELRATYEIGRAHV